MSMPSCFMTALTGLIRIRESDRTRVPRMFHLRFRLRSLIILVIPAVGIGPDRIRYGFAYRPNPEGTPFGRHDTASQTWSAIGTASRHRTTGGKESYAVSLTRSGSH